MYPKGDDNAWVAQFIHGVLRSSPKAITRDELSELVLEQQHLAGVGRPWELSTAARRVREAIAASLDSDTPVISAGGGFKLAIRATAAERECAARRRERVAQKEWAGARKIRAITLAGDPVMGELFPEVRA